MKNTKIGSLFPKRSNVIRIEKHKNKKKKKKKKKKKNRSHHKTRGVEEHTMQNNRNMLNHRRTTKEELQYCNIRTVLERSVEILMLGLN